MNIIVAEQNEKKQKYHTVGTIPKLTRKIQETGKIDTHKTHIHGRSLSWLGTDTSMQKWRG